MDGLKKLWVLHLFFSESSFGKNAFHNSTYIASLVMYSGTCIELRIFSFTRAIFFCLLNLFHMFWTFLIICQTLPFQNEMRFMLDEMTEWDAIFQKSDQIGPKNMKKIWQMLCTSSLHLLSLQNWRLRLFQSFFQHQSPKVRESCQKMTMTNFVHLTEGFTPRDLRRAATDIQSKFKTNKGESIR